LHLLWNVLMSQLMALHTEHFVGKFWYLRRNSAVLPISRACKCSNEHRHMDVCFCSQSGQTLENLVRILISAHVSDGSFKFNIFLLCLCIWNHSCCLIWHQNSLNYFSCCDFTVSSRTCLYTEFYLDTT
jgi:hypothetical protein